MTKQEISDIVKNYIAEGKVPEALKALAVYVKGDSYLENDVLMQTAAFNRNKNDSIKGLVSHDNAKMANAKVNYAITQILGKLPQNGEGIAPSGDGTATAQTTATRSILFLSANPKDTGRLQLGKELKNIKTSLALGSKRDLFNLVSETAVEISNITRAMISVKPEIVHFSGHGTGDDGIVVEDNQGNSVLFPTNGLDRLFKLGKNYVKCVVLNACYSKEQAKVISQHGIYVVGMNNAVGDKAAIDLAIGFYQGLSEGTSFEDAFQIALINNSANLEDADIPELWLNGEIV